MIRIKGRTVCENCFEETTSHKCPCCGYDTENSANDPTMLAPGSILFKKYIVGGVIGKGGFGITYLAYDTKANKKVAVKEYFPYSIAHRSAGSTVVSVASESNKETFELGAEKFYEEAQLISKFIGNPNIVEVYEFFYENDTVYLAMEYLQGCTLKEYIRDHGVISAPQALYIANGVSNALAEAHGASVLHRDISPDNIVLCSSEDVKLIDFGAARQVIAEYSQSFSVILKHGFAPLEQYNSKGNQGPWTDIYSLGATLYYALTGDVPEDPMIRFDNDDTFKENQFGIE
ncbi:MAG: serine/threonine protein kinase, partial [Oscillospiraceae bacterium]|nr:serine/threonine protein kinase [Oscillospiraceae bacterium]